MTLGANFTVLPILLVFVTSLSVGMNNRAGSGLGTAGGVTLKIMISDDDMVPTSSHNLVRWMERLFHLRCGWRAGCVTPLTAFKTRPLSSAALAYICFTYAR